MSRSFKVVEGDLKKKSDKKNDNFLIVEKVINIRNRFPFLKKKNWSRSLSLFVKE